MQEMRLQSLGWEDPLVERTGNALQYSCLKKKKKKIPWTEKPGMLQGSKESDTTEQLNVHTQAWKSSGI